MSKEHIVSIHQRPVCRFNVAIPMLCLLAGGGCKRGEGEAAPQASETIPAKYDAKRKPPVVGDAAPGEAAPLPGATPFTGHAFVTLDETRLYAVLSVNKTSTAKMISLTTAGQEMTVLAEGLRYVEELAVAGDWVYFSASPDGTATRGLYRVPKIGGAVSEVMRAGRIAGVTARGGDLYWAAGSAEERSADEPPKDYRILRARAAGGEPETLYSKQPYVVAMTVTASGIYWGARLEKSKGLGESQGVIVRGSHDGKPLSAWSFLGQRPACLVNRGETVYVLTEGSESMMFTNGMVLEVPKHPTEQRFEVVASPLTTPTGLTAADDALYVQDGASGVKGMAVWRIPFDGQPRRLVARSLSFSSPAGHCGMPVAVDGDRLYVLDEALSSVSLETAPGQKAIE